MSINKETFVQELMNLAPSINDLMKRNLPQDYINQFIDSYKCYSKSGGVKIYSHDELLMLLQTYDCSKIEIGIISFLDNIIEHEGYFEIGAAEQDILALDKATREVQVLDYEEPDYVIWAAASSGDNFLHAMLSAAEFLTLKVTNYPPKDLPSRVILDWVQKCSHEAGGNKYIGFYKMLLGYFD